ncbi:hypothetical protein [Microbispora maris]|uniref:hypothetical protein n=1 Tax=Microbispora maris TaxID=3144104 RepID=UPI0031FD774D
MMIEDFTHPDNTYVIIEPDEEDSTWFASVALLEDGRYEVEYRDTLHREHRVTVKGGAARRLAALRPLGGRACGLRADPGRRRLGAHVYSAAHP